MRFAGVRTTARQGERDVYVLREGWECVCVCARSLFVLIARGPPHGRLETETNPREWCKQDEERGGYMRGNNEKKENTVQSFEDDHSEKG